MTAVAHGAVAAARDEAVTWAAVAVVEASERAERATAFGLAHSYSALRYLVPWASGNRALPIDHYI